jgi:UDP-N-acetylglucosamine--dolichyl-phosphate N-acetylglucosaminephosphotransferase
MAHLHRFDPSTGLLLPSRVEFVRPPPLRSVVVLRLLHLLHLVDVEQDTSTGTIKSATNLTLPTVILVIGGPMKEASLTKVVMVLQVLGSCIAFAIRYGLASLLYDGDRR